MKTPINCKILIIVLFLSFVPKTIKASPIEKPQPDQAYILITFDDLYLKSWQFLVNEQKKYPDMRFSFFLAYFSNSFFYRHLEEVKSLQVFGNALEFHTKVHKSVDAYSSPKKFMETEVYPMLNQWLQNGFRPVAFAYPQNKGSVYTDLLIYSHFKWIRRKPFGEKIENPFHDDQYFKHSKNLCDGGPLVPFNLSHADFNNDYTPSKKWIEALDRIAKNKETIITYSHLLLYDTKTIPQNLKTDYVLLEQLLGLRKELQKRNIKMISFNDLRYCN